MSKKPGRKQIPDAPASQSPSSSDIGWAAGVFQAAGFFDREVTEVALRMPTAFVLLLRVPQKETDYDVLERFLTFFGGRIRATTTPGRFEWICRAERAYGVLLTFFQFWGRTVRGDARAALERDGQVVIRALPTTAVKSVPAKRDLIVPKHHMALGRDYDESVLLNIESVEPGEAFVYRLPDEQTLASFIELATQRAYVVLQQVELTVSLTRPSDY